MIASRFYLLAIAANCAVGLVIPSTHEVHERRESLHPRWIKRNRIESRRALPMRIGLTQNLDDAEDYLMDVSDPSSPNFGRYWTQDKVIETFRPSNETLDAVRIWLTSSGIADSRIVHTDNKAWYAFDASVKEAEDLLHTEYHEYHDSVTGGRLPGCERYHLPTHLRKHIDYVTPGIKLMAPTGSNLKATRQKQKAERQKQKEERTNIQRRGTRIPPGRSAGQLHPQVPSRGNLSTCDEAITPACISALYKVPLTGKERKTNPANAMGIFESELQFYAQEDLDLFFANFTPYIPQGTHPKLDSIDGPPGSTTNLSFAGGEADLDFQLSYPIVYPQKITLFQVDDVVYEAYENDTYTFSFFNTFLDALDGSYCTYSAFGETGDDPTVDPTYPDPAPGGYKGQLQCGVYKPTNVISLSYGGQEADLPAYYQRRQCNEYLKLGLQGVSIFFASGDAGVGNYPAPYGFDNPETGCLGPNGTLFNPTAPNSCPYVTNVGATKVYPGKTVFEPESAVYDPAGHPYAVNYSSGGGFSNVFAPASYQKQAIATYFAEHDPQYPYYSAIVNETSEIPSLGANGGIYNRIGRGIPDVAANGDNSAIYNEGEFSLSGGTSAATPIFASIVNRINEERLAANKTVVGFINPTLYKHPQVLNDITNGTNPGCLTQGFSAVKGWDPVTGLGTPNYEKMLKLYMSLP